ncbi:SIR2 family protein [Microvirga terricola]|uniref:SIR2-like domain-containing protein n=1 Tax=Microvirga terricola TaxID=2719797 RepID=A0ABX0VF49_9HYPH|nr:SIR2 family protein [Microvirga terricola]NIX78108.1 hypothetical protein [Microvirga terricola]
MRTIEEALNETLFPGNRAAFSGLKAKCASGNIICLVGAGASAPLYPTWTAALSELLTKAQVEGRMSDPTEAAELRAQVPTQPLDVASMLEDYFGKPVFRARLADMFRGHDQECTASHELIVRLNAKGIVTTNYDNGLDVAFSKYTARPPVTMRAHEKSELTRWVQNRAFGEGRLPIFHLHGTPSNPDQMIFTLEDYDRFYSEKDTQTLVEQLWRSESLVAIGFGFADPFLTRVAEHTLLRLPTDTRHFAIIGHTGKEPISNLARKQFARKYRLDPIFYEVRDSERGENTDHSDLQIILEALTNVGRGGSLESAETKGTDGSGASVITVQSGSTSVSASAQNVRREFEQHLHFAPSGRLLYVEPRLVKPEHAASDTGAAEYAPVSIADVLKSDASYLISARPEYGLSTLCRRLYKDLLLMSAEAHLRDAESLPNYKKKLQEEFSGSKGNEPPKAVLILDNFDQERHERLLKELVGLNYFRRFILCSQSQGGRSGAGASADALPMKADVLILEHLDRTDIRSLASALYNTSDQDLVSTVVDKVYSDLLDLCIPLTPGNVVMYLTILHREGHEGDFHPLSRVQIIERYIQQLLRRPSDAYAESFNTKNKLDVVSAFVYDLHLNYKTYFSDADWTSFCQKYKNKALMGFDDKSLLLDLVQSRVVTKIGAHYYFKYRLFYSYFLGYYVANRPTVLADFIKQEAYLSAESLVEVISGIGADNTALVTDLVTKLDSCISEFNSTYGSENVDPFEELVWPVHTKEEEELWQPLAARIEAGPASQAELDQVKRSLLAEKRTHDQTVVLRKFDEMERRLVAYCSELREALKNSDTIDGSLKKHAVESLLDSMFVVYRVGIMYAPLIAKYRTYIWNGIVFHNTIEYSPEDRDDQEKRTFIVLMSLAHSFAEGFANTTGTRKLSEVFRVIGVENKVSAYKQYVNFTCLLRSKPRNWNESVEHILTNTPRTSYYLRKMLGTTFRQFHSEVNTGQDRERLKRIVAFIRAKRDLKKDNPGAKLVKNVLGQLEDQKAFEPNKDKPSGSAD